MTPDAAVIYASETSGVLRAMAFLLAVAGMLILWTGGAWLMLKLRVRGWKRAEKKHIEEKARMLRDLAELKTQVGDVDALKTEVRRATRIREKTEQRLKEQNVELEVAKTQIEFLQRIVDHVDT